MIKKRFLKRILALLVLASTVASLFGCFEPTTYEKDGVEYKLVGDEYCIVGVSDTQNERSNEVIYILDEIDGKKVGSLGVSFVGTPSAYIILSYTERIYFPWCLEHSSTNHQTHRWACEVGQEDTLKYVISASSNTLIDLVDHGHKYVVPKEVFLKLMSGEQIDKEDFRKEHIDLFIPANISFFFNYENNPNEGYFFVDIIEETGKLTKPPYDPKREGYTFDGWYKEAECINKWNFDIDEVSIEFDTEGERIYEEICLYAKWVENN